MSTCQFCQQSFTYTPSRGPKRLYCSPVCRHKSYRTKQVDYINVTPKEAEETILKVLDCTAHELGSYIMMMRATHRRSLEEWSNGVDPLEEHNFNHSNLWNNGKYEPTNEGSV